MSDMPWYEIFKPKRKKKTRKYKNTAILSEDTKQHEPTKTRIIKK